MINPQQDRSPTRAPRLPGVDVFRPVGHRRPVLASGVRTRLVQIKCSTLAKATSEKVVRRVLDWLQKFPAA